MKPPLTNTRVGLIFWLCAEKAASLDEKRTAEKSTTRLPLISQLCRRAAIARKKPMSGVNDVGAPIELLPPGPLVDVVPPVISAEAITRRDSLANDAISLSTVADYRLIISKLYEWATVNAPTICLPLPVGSRATYEHFNVPRIVEGEADIFSSFLSSRCTVIDGSGGEHLLSKSTVSSTRSALVHFAREKLGRKPTEAAQEKMRTVQKGHLRRIVSAKSNNTYKVIWCVQSCNLGVRAYLQFFRIA